MSSRGTTGDSNAPQGQMQTNQGSQLFIDETIRKNFTYIYAILITLLILLILAFFLILYIYIRRRRRHVQRRLLRANASAEEDSSSNDAQRRKKHKHHGKKPKLASAWIGDGPLPVSLSTEALLEVIQPFSLANAGEKSLLHEYAARNAENASMKGFSSHSTTSLTLKDDEKAASTLDLSNPQRPQMHDIQLLNAGFLIAMPVQRSNATATASLRLRGLSNSPSSLSLAPSSSEGSCESDNISLAESRWTDHLCHGELPELTLGISTISVLRPSTTTTL